MPITIKTQGGPGGKLGLSLGGGVKRQGGPGGKLDRGLHLPVQPHLTPRSLGGLAQEIARRAQVIAQTLPHLNDLGSSGGHRDHANRLHLCTVRRGGSTPPDENVQIRVGQPAPGVRTLMAGAYKPAIPDVLHRLMGWLNQR